MYAIIENGNKQYKVAEGDIVKVEKLGVEDKQIVKVKVDTTRPVIFDDCVVRVSPSYALAMHVDTDEANAALIGRSGCQGEIVL